MINIAILGFGTIGSGVFEIIENNSEIIAQKLGDALRVKAVLVRRVMPDGRAAKKMVRDFGVIEKDADIDVIVETMGGTREAYDYIKRALFAGKHVVTANKALVAAYGTELLRLAEGLGLCFLFEASVGGGIPLLKTIAASMAGEHITHISGILNGTTNYILTQMYEKENDFEEALGKAQQLGYAERDPQADIEGYDTGRKIAILASIITGREVDFRDIYTEGISTIEKTDFEYAQKMGASIKLFGSLDYEEGKLYAYVCPKLIRVGDLFHSVGSVYNAVMIESDMLGKTMLYGSGAGKLPTASAIIADILSIFKYGEHRFAVNWSEPFMKVEEMDKTTHRYFVRFSGKKEEDIAYCARAFGKSETMYLEGKDEFGVLTGFMREKDFKAVLSGTPQMVKFIRADFDDFQ